MSFDGIEFKECRLDDIAEIHNSKRIPLNSRDREKRKGIYPYYGASGIVDYLDGYLFDGEYVLISEDGENLRSRNTPIAFKADGKFWVNNHAHILKGKEPLINDYIVYYFANLDLNPYVTGAVQPKLNKENLLSIPIRIPKDRKKREQIVSILKSLDDKIVLNRQTNQTLEAIAHAIFKEWFVDFNFPGATGEMQDSELGEIPKGWRAGKLGDVCQVQNGYAFKSVDFLANGTNRVIKIKNISGNIVDVNATQFISDNVATNTDKKFKVVRGDLLIAMTGAEVGKIGLVPQSGETMWLNQRVGSFKEKIRHSNLYLYILLSSPEYYNVIQNSALGSAQPNISSSVIENIKCIVPNETTLLEFGNIVFTMFDKILENIYENQILTQLRDSLLPTLMKGEIELNQTDIINEQQKRITME